MVKFYEAISHLFTGQLCIMKNKVQVKFALWSAHAKFFKAVQVHFYYINIASYMNRDW